MHVIPLSAARRRPGWRYLAAAAVLGISLLAGVPASGALMRSAPPGQVEAGVPAFVVLGPEALGLSGPPTDLHLLPDGRVLAVAQRELALGDGMRWETLRAAPGQEPIYRTVVVDEGGHIYHGVDGGLARVDFGTDGFWRSTRLTALPPDPRLRSTMVSVQDIGPKWYWYSGSGTVVQWRPGEPVRITGTFGSIERIFEVNDTLFVSDQSSGGLYRLQPGSARPERAGTAETLASETVVTVVPFAPGELLVGTNQAGLKVFDGEHFRPFGHCAALQGNNRINDLCAAGDGMFAAAVDNLGVVCFDRAGRLVQVLDRALDHRLARVQRLRYAPNGVLWCLLSDGVARVEFPSPVSQLASLVSHGLPYAEPMRFDGQLWLLADGRPLRGVYEGERLQGFAADGPPGRYTFTLVPIDEDFFAGSDHGIYHREQDAWRLIAPAIVNARIVKRTSHDSWLYVARGEYGVLRRDGEEFTTERIPVLDLGDNFRAQEDAAGVIWLELGTSRAGRLDPRGEKPSFRILTAREGITDGWVEIFIFEGIARLHSPSRVFRYEDATGCVVDDRELLARLPQLAAASGRPTTDAAGRLWYTLNGNANVLDLPDASGRRVARPVRVGFGPTNYFAEENGVVWMFGPQRLIRLDPKIPEPRPVPPRALLTSIVFPVGNRHSFAPGGKLEPVPYADNSVLFGFSAPSSPFASPVTFETLLEGAGDHWVSTGSVGYAGYNRLKEGSYVFRVRPVTASGVIGAEARVAFEVRPPWFRTPLAWTFYIFAAVGLIVTAAWLPSVLQRRENARLEQLVTRRTEELRTANLQLERQITETTEKSAALGASEDRYRKLNAELEQRVAERTAELSRSNTELQQRESLFRLMFEHAPVGISWKRADLGNVYHLNSTFRRILQLPSEQLQDYAVLLGLVHPEDVVQHHRMRELIGSGEIDSFSLELRFVLGGGQIVWGSLSVAVVRDGTGNIVQDIGILEDITARKQAEEQLATTYKNLVDASRVAGMAEVATGVLHNVGNVLNSLNVSSNLIATSLRQSKAESLARLSALVDEHAADLPRFLTEDPKGRLVPQLLTKLAQNATTERDWLLQETASVQKNIDHIKEIVAMQQSYATVVGVVETLDPTTLFEDALRMNSAALQRHDVHVVQDFQPVPLVSVEKGKVLQILTNLIRNAKYACDDAQQQYGLKEKTIVLRLQPAAGNRVRLIVQDNGVGIPSENLTRIFSHGFTTRAYGHGFGLHSSALTAQEMKGSLTAQSDGVGTGATFILEIPAAPATPALEAGISKSGSRPPGWT